MSILRPSIRLWITLSMAVATLCFSDPAAAQKSASSGPTFSSYRVAIDFLDEPYYRLVVNGPSGGGWASFYSSTIDEGSNWYRDSGTFGDAIANLTAYGTKTNIASATLSGILVAQDYDDFWYWDDNLQEWFQDYTLGAEHIVAFNLTLKATGVIRKYPKYEIHEMSVEGTVFLDGQPLQFQPRTSIQAWYR